MLKLDNEVWKLHDQVLHCGDAREVCQGFSDNCFDGIVTDPPFGEGIVAGDDSPEQCAR